ncbi:MAG: hypothetical protein JWM28_1656 [Chitinophagaceae bacterium]|nr:hypothetical protein [Chitinophagaceae bacterium]
MKTIMLFLIASASVLIVVTGCSKDPAKNLTEDESRIYITNHDSTYNFGASHTFTIADSVAVISNNQYVGKDLTAYDGQLIAALTAALVSQGYTLAEKGGPADLAVAVSVYNNDQTGIISYNDYGGYYGDYWDPYYWGYPGYSYYYPSYYGVYNFSETALAVDMFDLKNAAGTNQLKNVWSALIRGSGIFNSANINGQVQALFNQSAYLKIN